MKGTCRWRIKKWTKWWYDRIERKLSALFRGNEYTGGIHQLRRWSQELFVYDFSIIHRPATMTKDVDSLSCHPNLLIGQYLTNAYLLRSRDLHRRPFAYNYDDFHNCPNPRQVTATSRILVSTTPSTPTSAVIHHFSLQFLHSLSLLYLPTHSTSTPSVFISPQQCTWLSFDSIIPSFSSLLSPSPARTLHHFAFETNILHYRIASFLPSTSILHYTTLQHFIFSYCNWAIPTYIIYLIIQLRSNLLTLSRIFHIIDIL